MKNGAFIYIYQITSESSIFSYIYWPLMFLTLWIHILSPYVYPLMICRIIY